MTVRLLDERIMYIKEYNALEDVFIGVEAISNAKNKELVTFKSSDVKGYIDEICKKIDIE